jgi:hypothetical protein
LQHKKEAAREHLRAAFCFAANSRTAYRLGVVGMRRPLGRITGALGGVRFVATGLVGLVVLEPEFWAVIGPC